MIKKAMIIPVIIFSLLYIMPTSVSAKKIVIGYGKLTMDQPNVGDFAPITLTGDLQTSDATISGFKITDGRGTGEGWKIMITATQFTDVTTNRTIPMDSVQITAPKITARGGSSDVNTLTVFSGTIDNPVGLKLISASKNGGMGKYDADTTPMTITLLPKNTFAGTYTSTLTFDIVSGP